MSVHLVTGYAGKEHITSADNGIFNAGVIGKGKYVLKTGNMFAYEIVNNNRIKIRDGDLINQGRHINIAADDYEEVDIDNGLQSVKRHDLIAIRYSKNTETGVEKAEVIVIKGTSAENPTDPAYISGDLTAGATEDDFPLYRIRINGINMEAVEPMFSGPLMSIQELISGLKQTNNLLEKKAPLNHSSTATTYGAGTESAYGHLKISDNYSYAVTGTGIAASQKALIEAKNGLSRINKYEAENDYFNYVLVFKQMGVMRIRMIGLKKALSSTVKTYICTLPVACWPVSSGGGFEKFVVVAASAAAQICARIFIDTNGSLYITAYADRASGSQFYLDEVYI